MIETFLLTLFALLIVHALADYPLQGDFLARAKNHVTPIPGVPWAQALTAHALIHAGGVWLVTGSVVLALLEFWAHWIIDFNKSAGSLTFNQDQALHVVCKVIYALVLALGLPW